MNIDTALLAIRADVLAAFDALGDDDYLGALRAIGRVPDRFADAAGDIVQEAYNAGATKKAIAEALGVPPSTFRGMTRGGGA